MYEANFYLVNVYDKTVLEISKRLSKDQQFNSDDFIFTKITFNRGSKWINLEPPKLDLTRTSFKCPKVDQSNKHLPCRLNLHLAKTDRYQGITALKYAPGYVVALGNVGPYLSDDEGNISVFTSSDGGITWNESLKGPWMFTASTYGDILIAAPTHEKTHKIMVSNDWGTTWDEYSFNDDSANNDLSKSFVIRIKPLCEDESSPCTMFEITSREKKNPKFEYLNKIMIIDFKDPHSIPYCKGKDVIEAASSDFEKFFPHTPDDQNCKLQIKRFHGSNRILYKEKTTFKMPGREPNQTDLHHREQMPM